MDDLLSGVARLRMEEEGLVRIDACRRSERVLLRAECFFADGFAIDLAIPFGLDRFDNREIEMALRVLRRTAEFIRAHPFSVARFRFMEVAYGDATKGSLTKTTLASYGYLGAGGFHASSGLADECDPALRFEVGLRELEIRRIRSA